MLNVYDVQSEQRIGQITDAQLRFLQAQLEEEDAEDQDYFINVATLDMFAKRGADADLLAMLRDALGQRESMDIRWERV